MATVMVALLVGEMVVLRAALKAGGWEMTLADRMAA